MKRNNDEWFARLAADRSWLRRFARQVAHPFRDLLPDDELDQLVDLGLVAAWQRYREHRRRAFTTYARKWVVGTVMAAVRSELKQREVLRRLEPVARVRFRPDLERQTIGRDLLRRLPPSSSSLLCRHFGGGERASELAAAAGRHRCWGTRRLQRAMEELQTARDSQ